MKKLTYTEVSDFVLDEKFRDWVYTPSDLNSAYWEDWLVKNPEHADKLHEARRLLLQLPKIEYKLNEDSKQKLWQSILEDAQPEHSDSLGADKVMPLYPAMPRIAPARRSGYHLAWKVAATVIVVLGATLFLYRKSLFTDPVETQQHVERIVKSNPYGQKSTLYLGDGSEVVLNAGSSLILYGDFGVTERRVELEGEAYFKVAKNASLPFSVVSQGVVTTALGTSFNVKSVHGKTKVALVTGQVRVENESASRDVIMLNPGEQAIYSIASNTLAKDSFDVRLETGWINGIICFKDAGADEVFSYLEKWYGVEITETNKSPVRWNYTGEFKDMTLYRVMESIGFTMNFEFVTEGGKVRVTYIKKA